ncbi:MAG: bifunctional 4-hydroxy-2-oxoglutarate aldolase/2-dehydro-3-deoxy-phosphogluconate aldolase [Sphaerochaetaceae bacterium]|jgi:2-dehydro-3-deoxyphosphogluconate aldolase/(4S)-4-hydroxy-2-oxoglutarate aldolase
MLMSQEIEARIKESGVIAVLVLEEFNHIRPTVESLLSGGVKAVELTLRTALALEAIEVIHTEYPQMLLGVGTILTPQQVEDAKRAGADFGVAPGLNRNVMDAALKAKLPFAPGVATPSDIEAALEYGCNLLKFFPAEPLGGLSYLKSMYAPYAHLGLSFIPLGGISQDNLSSYAKEACIGGIGGSWIASKDLIANEQWDVIENQARQAVQVFSEEKRYG